MKSNVPTPLLSSTQLCSFLGISKATLYRRLGDSLLPKPIYVGKKMPRWRAEVIEAWLNSQAAR